MKVAPEKAGELLKLFRKLQKIGVQAVTGAEYICECDECKADMKKALEEWDPYEVDRDATEKAKAAKYRPTPDECVEIGGHCWAYFSIDAYAPDAERTPEQRAERLRPGQRRCNHCGLTEKKAPGWEPVDHG